MMKTNSRISFEIATADLAFIKVYWNHKLVYDDTDYIPLTTYREFMTEYGTKLVYKMRVKFVEQHHCIIKVRGEK